MADNLPAAPTANRPSLNIPKEIQIPGTKVKVPTWLPVAGGVLLVVLVVLWQKRKGGETYEPDISEEQAQADQSAGEAGAVTSGSIEDIPTQLPAPAEQPTAQTIPNLSGLDEQSAPVYDYGYSEPVSSYPSFSAFPEVAPGDATPAARPLVGQATSSSTKPAQPVRRIVAPTAPVVKTSPSIKQATAGVSTTSRTPLGMVTAGVSSKKSTAASAPAKKPAPAPILSSFIKGIRISLFGR